jgi:5-methylcytosine-specific restriction endonuclease McrA
MTEYTCKYCGDKFHSHIILKQSYMFCSSYCRIKYRSFEAGKNRHEAGLKRCIKCGKNFLPTKSTLQDTCQECKTKIPPKNRERKICPICGESFIPEHTTNQMYCSVECRKKARSKLGGIPPELREFLLEEANYTCERCGKRTLQLHAHHKVFLCHGGEDSLDNIEVLCWNCHYEAHKYKP